MVVLRVLKELYLTCHPLSRLLDVQHVRVEWKHLVFGIIRHVESVFLSSRNSGRKRDVLNLGLSPESPMVVPQMPVPVEEVDAEGWNQHLGVPSNNGNTG
jgi:hypothetical protein